MVCLLAATLGLQAQSYKLVLPEGIPADAAKVTSRVETPGSMSQTALTIDLVATAGDVVATFPIKGVGESDADAWLRAVKQLLPRSKNALEFVEKLK